MNMNIVNIFKLKTNIISVLLDSKHRIPKSNLEVTSSKYVAAVSACERCLSFWLGKPVAGLVNTMSPGISLLGFLLSPQSTERGRLACRHCDVDDIALTVRVNRAKVTDSSI